MQEAQNLCNTEPENAYDQPYINKQDKSPQKDQFSISRSYRNLALTQFDRHNKLQRDRLPQTT